MLSYRHAFHAGNFADVLKHHVLMLVIDHFNLKDKPYWLIDTHAGAGIYDLDRGHAARNAEWVDGIGRLWQHADLPPALAAYVRLVARCNPAGRLARYPGSPLIAMHLLRPDDRLRLFELHGSDVPLLARALTRDFPGAERRYAIRQADGFAELRGLLPPPPRRGLVLIDPAYEDKRDYLRVPATVKEGLARFAGGCFVVWLPMLPRGDARQLPERLKKLAGSGDWLCASLAVHRESSDGFGMHGSCVFVINPPWTLAANLRQTLPWLADALAQDDGARWQLEVGDEAPPQRPRRNQRSSSSSGT